MTTLKYLNTEITFREFPDEISLCINITNCPYKCENCHSPELREDIGQELNKESLAKLIEANKGITCVGFMGGDIAQYLVSELAEFVKNKYPELKVGWYSGSHEYSNEVNIYAFDYIKVGPYIEEKGGLDSPTTNQRMYKAYNCNGLICWENITNKFWKNGK